MSNTSSLPFIEYGKQFPVVLTFDFAIKKSQGQSFDHVGMYVYRPLFRCQLYVALSKNQIKTVVKIQCSASITNWSFARKVTHLGKKKSQKDERKFR